MSRDGLGATRQVWLPSSGVWAVLPEQSTELDKQASSSRRTRRKHSTTKRSDKKGALEPRVAGDGDPHAQQLRAGSSADEEPAAAGAAGSAAPPAAASGGGGSVRPLLCQAAAPGSGYTGFELQHSDLEVSDVEAVEPPPTCPICEHHRSTTRAHCCPRHCHQLLPGASRNCPSAPTAANL